MDASTYAYRKAQFARVDSDPSPYNRSVKFYGTGADGQTNQMDLTDAEYRRVKEAMLDYPADSFRLVVYTCNAAFDGGEQDGGPGFEVARILRELADKLEQGFIQFPQLTDANGNPCGEASFH